MKSPNKHPIRPHSVTTHPKLFVLSWAVTVLLSPIIGGLVLSLFVYRTVIRFLATRLGGLQSALTPYDCIFAVDSYHTRPYASNLTVLELNKRVDIDTVRSMFKERILDQECFQKLKCVPTEFGGYWFWRRLSAVDLHSTIRVFYDSELDHGVGKSVDQVLTEIVEMPYGNELFNVCLVHVPKASFIVFRIHHTVCDGYSFNKLVDRFVGLESKYLVKCSSNYTSGWGSFLTEVSSEAVKLAKLLFHLPLHFSTLYREALTHTPNYYTQPKTSTTGQIRRTVFPLEEIRNVRKVSSTHFATIGMSLMTGALQKLFDERGTNNSGLLRPERLSIMHSLPKPNHPLNKLCNHWGVGLFKVPFTRNPVERLVGAEDDFNEYMGLQFDRLLHIHMPLLGLVPCAFVKWFFSINFGTSCGFTSVPGLFDRVAYVGQGGAAGGLSRVDEEDGGVTHDSKHAEVKHMWKVFGLQWRQSAVAVAMYTYRNEASMSVYANGDVIRTASEMDRLVELLHQEFSELVQYTSSKQNSIASAPDQKFSKIQSEENERSSSAKKHHNASDNNYINTLLQRSLFRSNKLA